MLVDWLTIKPAKTNDVIEAPYQITNYCTAVGGSWWYFGRSSQRTL
jgi:hypothetical protein